MDAAIEVAAYLYKNDNLRFDQRLKVISTLAALTCQVKPPLSIHIEGVMITATCLKTGLDSTMTILAGDRQHSILLDGQAQNPGLPSLRECISCSYGQARWLYELPGRAADPESDE